MPREAPARDRIALALATGLGIGYASVAPGTWGSLPGVALAALLTRWAGGWAVLGGATVVAAVGLWAADRAARRLGETDPGQVVVDEIAGQMVTLAFLPCTARVLVAGFFVFRALDVWKPWPANRLEALPGGSGIMADDLMAGLYGNLLLHLIAHWQPGWLGAL
ncbi:MAG TPA: phosphatidylglycerophosphatase A [Candidatus Polarisedimenticolaceae bacterium]|nr:phosphatidylglycerophosphatase A [Candidatus Polarisedimenticolaceae bacterium]